MVFAFCLLLFVSQTELPPEIVDVEMPALSLELDVGSPAETSAEGTFYWITKTKSTLILANNTALPVKAALKGVLSVSPCSYEAPLTIEANGLRLSGEIGPFKAPYQIDSLVSLRPYERRAVKLYISGRGCPTAPSDGRVILMRISALTLTEIEK